MRGQSEQAGLGEVPVALVGDQSQRIGMATDQQVGPTVSVQVRHRKRAAVRSHLEGSRQLEAGCAPVEEERDAAIAGRGQVQRAVIIEIARFDDHSDVPGDDGGARRLERPVAACPSGACQSARRRN
jgi:hypothetical protein